MKAEIVSIGTELLLGEIQDTNTHFLAGQLAALGIDLFFVSMVGDNRGRLTSVLKQAWQRSDLIITTGGLGPTQGDITREMVAELVGEKPEVDEALKQELVAFFANRGVAMPQNNIKQAMLIPSARAVSNPIGTAPGWWVEKDGRTIVCMPGPPGEMQRMWRNEIGPRLQSRGGGLILSRIIKVFGISESKLDELLSPYLGSANPTVAMYAKPDGIQIRITAKAAGREQAGELIAKREAEVKSLLGEAVWGYDEDRQEEVARRLMTEQGLSLALAESFTGGYLTSLLTGADGGRGFLKGGIVTGNNETRALLGLMPQIEQSLTTADMAAALAAAVRRKLKASLGLALEIENDTTEPGGTVKIYIAIDSAKANRKQVQSYLGRPHLVRNRAVYYALTDLIRFLKAA